MFTVSVLVLLASAAALGDPIERESELLSENEMMDFFHVKSVDELPEYEVVYPELTEDDMVFMMESRPDRIQAETLQVRLNAFDENLHLTVHQDSSGFSPDFVMEEISSTGSREVPVCLGCLYSGKVASEPDSMVAMTTMSGMHAIIYHAKGTTSIKPLSSNHFLSKRGLGIAHVAYRHTSNEEVQICGVVDKYGPERDELPTGIPFLEKRQGGSKKLELALFGDNTLFDQTGNHGTLADMLLIYISARALLQSTTLHDNLKVELVYGGYFTQRSDLPTVASSSTSLPICGNDQLNRNPSSRANSKHWDNAAYLTRLDLTRASSGSNNIGLAYFASCGGRNSVSITEIRINSIAVVTLAHEIGHNLGILHDGNTCPTSRYIMSPSINPSSVPSTWSSCSKSQFQTRLGRTTCYND